MRTFGGCELQRVPKPKRRARKRKPMKRVNRKRGGSAFPHRRDYAYLAFVRTYPCAICVANALTQESPTRACHVKSRGAGGDDVSNTYPGCDRHHEEQHLKGFAHMKRKYRVDLQDVALRLGEQYARAA